ncbi:MAG: hypothetical protein HYZ81_16775, partial [Nitrospinae bacterium]|nr:hypothetical protein [Nitrospinota bacterium]
MGRRWLRIGAFVTLLVVTAIAVTAQSPGMLGRSLDRLASEVAALFPKIEGDVVKIDREGAFIALGAPDQIREGMELALFRKGEEFKHPLTGAVLGRLEEDLGALVIQQVSESYSRGTVRPSKPGITVRPGDHVRITKGKISVALLPLLGELPPWVSRDELLDRLRVALEQTGRFQVAAGDSVRVYLTEKGLASQEPLSEEAMGRLAQDLRVAYGVLSQTRQIGGEWVLETRLVGLAHPRTLLTGSAIIPESAPMARAEPERGGGREVESGRTRPEVHPGLFKEPRKTSPGYRLDLSNLDLGKTLKELMSVPSLVTS